MERASPHDVGAASRRTVLCLSLLLAACGGGGGGGGPTVVERDGSVAEVLNNFGIDTTPTPRRDDDGRDLPSDFSPLGTTMTVGRFEELALFGVPLDPDAGLGGSDGGRAAVLDFDLDGTRVEAELLADPATAGQPWFATGVVRGATAGDIDADGLDELVIAWQSEADAAVELVVVDEVALGGTPGEPLVIATGTELRALELVADDLDGDGTVDVAVALVDAAGAVEILALGNAEGSLSDSGARFSVDAASGSVQVAMRSGNVDRDGAREIALVVNVFQGGVTSLGSNVTEASSRWFLLDDLGGGLSELAGEQSVVTTAAGPVVARVADIDLGDVDGDGVDEIVLGGLDRIGRQGGSEPAPDYLVEIRDDARANFARLVGERVDAGLPTGGSASGVSQHIYQLFVRTGDIDGDGAAEIVTNQLVWDDLRAAGGVLTPLIDEVATAQSEEETTVAIDVERLFSNRQRSYFFSASQADIELADVNGDERDDVVIWAQRQDRQNNPQDVAVFGLSMEAGFREYVSIETRFANSQNPWGARLLVGDYEINGDTAALRLADGSYRYELTEPVVLAVLAAAPCSTELGQDLSSCRTGIGTSTTSGGTDTSGWAFVANVSVGWDVRDPITQSGASVILRTRNEVRGYTSEAYRTTFSLLRETGPIEDTVIFTTVPYDIWSYEVLSHPDPAVVGRTLEVRLPREPIDIMTTREIYNTTTAPDAFKIDETVLGHTPGDPGSYPTAAQKNALLGRFAGIESESQTVGLNTGRQTVTIEQFEETTTGQAYSFRATVDAEGSAGGVVGGLEVGGGVDLDWSTFRGDGTLYQGQVAEVGPENPISASYEFGLFAYIFEPGGGVPPFEVLNYWVEDF